MNSRSDKRRIIIGILIAAVLIAAFGVGLNYFEKRGMIDNQYGDTGDWGREDDDDGVLININDIDYKSDDSIDTYLIIGTDPGREDMGEAYSGTLADFLTLLLVDNTQEKYAFIEIDRNTMVDVQILDDNGEFDSFYNEQICLSHWYGTDDEQRVLNVEAAVSALFGYIDIDNSYVLNMADIGTVNDALGGVEVEIQSDLTSVDPAFKQGATITLTDEQAEKYLRARMGVGEGTNKERMNRQTQYMSNVYNKVMNELKDNPEYLSELYNTLQGTVEAYETDSDMSILTNQILRYDNLGIQHIDGKTKIGDTQKDGVEHEEFYADNDSILDILMQLIDLKEAPEEADEEEETEGDSELTDEDLEDIVVIEEGDEGFEEETTEEG